MRILVKQRFGGQDPTIQAVPALKCLLFDERRLQRMKVLGRSKSFQSDNRLAGRARHWQETGSDRAVVDKNGACSALAEPAAESRIVQGKIVPQDVEQRTLGIHIYDVGLGVDVQNGSSHAEPTVPLTIRRRNTLVTERCATKIWPELVCGVYNREQSGWPCFEVLVQSGLDRSGRNGNMRGQICDGPF